MHLCIIKLVVAVGVEIRKCFDMKKGYFTKGVK